MPGNLARTGVSLLERSTPKGCGGVGLPATTVGSLPGRAGHGNSLTEPSRRGAASTDVALRRSMARPGLAPPGYATVFEPRHGRLGRAFRGGWAHRVKARTARGTFLC